MHVWPSVCACRKTLSWCLLIIQEGTCLPFVVKIGVNYQPCLQKTCLWYIYRHIQNVLLSLSMIVNSWGVNISVGWFIFCQAVFMWHDRNHSPPIVKCMNCKHVDFCDSLTMFFVTCTIFLTVTVNFFLFILTIYRLAISCMRVHGWAPSSIPFFLLTGAFSMMNISEMW